MTRRSGFSLIELSVVLVLLATLTGGTLTLGKKWMESSEHETSQKFISTIDKAIETYVKANHRLPCPGAIALTESSSNFGKEAASPTQNTADLCANGTPAAMYVGGEVMAGSVPTEVLGLPKSMARDAWGNLIVYYVDRRMTRMDAFSTYNITNTTVGDITVNDLAGGNRTTKAVYATVSHGINKHGGFDRRGVQIVTSSTDTNEQENHDFDGSTGTAGDDRVLIQGLGSGTFDDLVSFKTRAQLRTVSAISESGTPCTASTVNWTQGGYTCTGNVAALVHGASASVVDSTLQDMGSVAVTCNNSTLQQSSIVCTHTPANCTATSRNWSQGGNNCTQSVPALTHGASTTLTDSTAPATGTSTATCNDGTVNYTSETCYAQCAGAAQSWTVSGQTCNQSVATLQHGQSSTISDSTNPTTGSVTMGCNNGSWSQSSASCNYNFSNCSANATYSWSASGNTCTASLSALSHGQSATITDSVQTSTGSVTATCTDGVLSNSSASCNLQCAANTANWTVSGQSCSSSHSTINHSASAAVTDSTAPSTGGATLTCTNGVISQSGTSCATECTGSTANWTVSGQNCSQTYSTIAHGGSVNVTDSTAPSTGAATLSCSNGTVGQSGTSCVTQCTGGTANWTVGGSACSQTYSTIAHGGSTAITDSTAPTTGSVTLTCANGTANQSGASCTTAPSCGGVTYGGYCWYHGGANQSCDTVCASRGGCNSAGIDYVGAGWGYISNCEAVHAAMGYPASGGAAGLSYDGVNVGCGYVYNQFSNSWHYSIDLSGGAGGTCAGSSSFSGEKRTCACNN